MEVLDLLFKVRLKTSLENKNFSARLFFIKTTDLQIQTGDLNFESAKLKVQTTGLKVEAGKFNFQTAGWNLNSADSKFKTGAFNFQAAKLKFSTDTFRVKTVNLNPKHGPREILTKENPIKGSWVVQILQKILFSEE